MTFFAADAIFFSKREHFFPFSRLVQQLCVVCWWHWPSTDWALPHERKENGDGLTTKTRLVCVSACMIVPPMYVLECVRVCASVCKCVCCLFASGRTKTKKRKKKKCLSARKNKSAGQKDASYFQDLSFPFFVENAQRRRFSPFFLSISFNRMFFSPIEFVRQNTTWYDPNSAKTWFVVCFLRKKNLARFFQDLYHHQNGNCLNEK